MTAKLAADTPAPKATISPFCELTKEQWLVQAKKNRPTWTDAELELSWEQFVEARGKTDGET